MSFDPGTEPIADDEVLFRRIPVSKGWYSESGLSPEAFEPRDDEATGISFSRGKYKSVQDAGQGKSKKGYYVAVIRAVDLRTNNIAIAPRPETDDPGHAELPGLTCDTRLTPEALNLKHLLATLPVKVEGPFVTPTP